MPDLAHIDNTNTTPPASMQRARGTGRLVTQVRDGRTHIAELYQEGCAKIRLPRTHSNALEAVLINSSGGVTGGDRLDWNLVAAPQSRLVVTSQACERVYKSTGADAVVSNTITIGADAHVDWLPQETILFEQSRLRRTLNVDLAEGASLTAVEAILLGREAMGEAARSALLNDNWRIHRNGQLIHAEANRLSAADLERDALSLLAGNNAFATILFIGDSAAAKVETVRALIPEGAKAAVSAINQRLTVRVLAPTGLALRRIITPIIAHLSRAGSLPRLWTT